MPTVELQTVSARKLAAVRREIPEGEVGASWGPALDQVWKFIRPEPGLWTDGHNIFVYHPNPSTGLLECEFGVEVTRAFDAVGEVHATDTPAGEAAVAVHRGPYDRLNEAYEAIDRWMTTNQRDSAGYTWEIYGDPRPDPVDTETTVVHLLTQP
jgi:hypothetical protein